MDIIIHAKQWCTPPFYTKIGGGVSKKPAAAAFGGVASYHKDTQATAIVPKLTMNSPS